MNTPLEQFKVILFFPIDLGILDFSITNTTIYLGLTLFFIFFIFVYGIQEGKVIPDSLQKFAEILYIFINNIVKQQGGLRSLKYFPIIFIVFYMILFLNLVGLTPYGFTCTSQICYTFMFGFSMFIGIVIIGIVTQKRNFIKQFIPETKGLILPLLVIIEIFSYCIRPFSLSIRLFANMLAGHTLLHILASFFLSLLNIDFILALIMLLPILAICVLEFGIAFLQAYVFIVLICIYLKEALYGH